MTQPQIMKRDDEGKIKWALHRGYSIELHSGRYEIYHYAFYSGYVSGRHASFDNAIAYINRLAGQI